MKREAALPLLLLAHSAGAEDCTRCLQNSGGRGARCNPRDNNSLPLILQLKLGFHCGVLGGLDTDAKRGDAHEVAVLGDAREEELNDADWDYVPGRLRRHNIHWKQIPIRSQVHLYL